jgi:hypothetical protein
MQHLWFDVDTCPAEQVWGWGPQRLRRVHKGRS